jgi:zinc and cadmium transporter
MQLMVSFVGGLMLGVGLFHLLPHGAAFTQSLDRAIWWMVAGLLTTFFLLRVFHFHQHDSAETAEHDHEHASNQAGQLLARPAHRDVMAADGIRWVGVALGLAVHTLIDGIALGAAVLSESSAGAIVPGFGIFLVVLLHKPLDSLSITSLMEAGGWSMRARQAVNIGFAMMCPLGALWFAGGVGEGQTQIIGCALAFSAGVFVCISLGDLLPELHFHSHDRVKLSATLLLGISIAYGIGYFEPHHEMVPPSDRNIHAGHSGVGADATPR